jgi:hypothetical protein
MTSPSLVDIRSPAASAPAKPSRWPTVRRVVLLLMAVLLAALGLLGYRWVDEARSYDGLVAGAQSGYSGAILREHRNIPGPDALVAAYTPGAEFAVWHVLSNLGGRSVRIEQLPGPAPFSYYGSVSVAVSRPHAADGRFDQGVRPFRPITLRPNEAVTVEYRLRMHDCKAKEEAGGTGAYSAVPVSYRVGPFTRSIMHSLSRPLAIEGGPHGECLRYDDGTARMP